MSGWIRGNLQCGKQCGYNPHIMNAQQRLFAVEYCKDWNATQAAIRAGYSKASAGSQGHDLLKNPEIQAEIEERKEAIANQATLDCAWVLREWMKIASADPNELTQVRRVNCRHCHGFGHQYQWTESEYAAATDRAINAGKQAPDGMGGFGFDVNREPHPGCPECGGNGVGQMHIADTRKLTGAARKLYAGVKRTKEGLVVMMRDQDAALTNLARYLGMLVDRKEISGPGGGPIGMANLTAEDLTDDQLAAILNADTDDAGA